MMQKNLDRQRLISCREKLGITKQEAAKRMQMSQPAYLRYESGDRTPSIHVIHFMAVVLGTSVAYLTGETDNPAPDYFIINPDNEPELFHLIESYKNSIPNLDERMLAYFNKLTESE